MDGLNEIINANRTNKNMGARIEKANVEWCYYFITRAMRDQRWQRMSDKASAAPCEVHITFVEANRRRDVPNIIGGGCKYVLDALSRPRYDRHGKITKIGAAAIYDDSVRWLTDCKTSVRVNKKKPGIEITVIRSD